MKIIRKNPFTNEINERKIDVTEQQLAAWESGTLIQDAMPNISPEDREFIKTGITPESWDELFGKREDRYAST